MKQVEEIEERVLSLSDILRSPRREDDSSESVRRELLCRFVCAPGPKFHSYAAHVGAYRRLVDVVIKLEPLSEQSGLLRFLRNEDHAGLLNGFVQDIANAVTDYQVRGPKTHSSR